MKKVPLLICNKIMLICENPIKELDENEKVSPLVTQLSWTNHLKIMSGSKCQEKRDFQTVLICNKIC